jgi:putative DNA primase/helicase
VAIEAADPEVSDRLTCVQTTFENHAGGNRISGRAELVNILGRHAVSAIDKWCGNTATPATSPPLPVNLTQIFTDAGAADAFAAEKTGELIYEPESQRWFKIHHQVFRPITPVEVQGETKRFLQAQVAKIETSGFGGPQSRTLLSRGKINNVAELSRHGLLVKADLLDSATYLVGCADGLILDLNQGKLVTETDAIVTKMLRFQFYPEAICPLWDQFLRQIFADDESVISFVRRASGYSLSGDTSEQCLFFLVGEGSNGKSTLLKVLQHVFGDYAATTPAQTLVNLRNNQQTDDLARLVGVRLAIATETENDQKLAEGKIKRITGGDRISCRAQYGHFFEYDPHFKLWLATNDPPQFSGGDESISRRIRVIKFPVTFDEAKRDYQLAERLMREAPGILNWTLQGYAEWKAQGLNPPHQVNLATKS